MERIRSFFENLGKEVISIQIDSKIYKRCSHCGHGQIITGSVILLDSESEEEKDFVFNTGCLSYDSEMDYE